MLRTFFTRENLVLDVFLNTIRGFFS